MSSESISVQQKQRRQPDGHRHSWFSISVSDLLRFVQNELFTHDDLRPQLPDRQAHSGNYSTRFPCWSSSGNLKSSSSCSCDAHRSSKKIGVVHSRGRQGLQQPHHQHYIDLHSRLISMRIPMFSSPSIQTLGSKKHECLSTNERSLLYKYTWKFLVIFRERESPGIYRSWRGFVMILRTSCASLLSSRWPSSPILQTTSLVLQA